MLRDTVECFKDACMKTPIWSTLHHPKGTTQGSKSFLECFSCSMNEFIAEVRRVVEVLLVLLINV